ncbi:MAG: DUF4097 family beta strand repeat-containing protein [Candidatus Coproplasma sp.]
MIKRNIYAGLCALLIAFAALVAGCSYTHSGGGESDYLYDNAESYTVGGGSVQADISAVEIDWIAGGIRLVYAEEPFIKLEEERDGEIPEEWILRYMVDGGTLKVKFAASGKWKFERFEKRLTVTLPEGLNLNELSIESVSADISAEKLSVKELDLDCVSGRLNVGKLTADEIDVDTVSGNVALGLVELPQSAEFDVVSANVALTVPTGSVFGLKLNTVSGNVDSALSYEKQGNAYFFGGGKVIFSVESVSGNVTVLAE